MICLYGLLKLLHVSCQTGLHNFNVLIKRVPLQKLLRRELAIDHLHRNQIAQDSLLVVNESLVSVGHGESFGQLVTSPNEIVVVHVVAPPVVGYLDVPCLWQRFDLLLVHSIDVVEVDLLEVVERELHADLMECKVV